MSLITCCPACGTMFKVVADQLKISEGWVRCGHCAQVFDAPAHMVTAEAPAVPVVAPPRTAVPPPKATPAPPPVVTRAPEPEPEPEPAPDLEREPAMPSRAANAAKGAAEPETAPSELQPDDVGGIAVEELPVFGAEDLEQAKADAAQADADLHDVSFIRDARRKAFWSRPLVRFALSLLLLALVALLGAQVAVQERDRLAATQPQLKPLLDQLCAPLGCKVGATRQIESVAIDSSSFSKLRPDTYRLNFTLKNSAPIPIATPSMELTLTDTQEQAVVRRVLAPSDLGASSPLLPAGGEWASVVTLSVSASAGSGRIAGYRLLAFYP